MLSVRSSYVVESNFTVVRTDYKSYAVIHRSDGYIYHSFGKSQNSEQCANHAKLWSRKPDLGAKFLEKVKT